MRSVTELVNILRTLKQATIITHVRPDGDTLGSAFALCHALERLGVDAHVVCDSEISPRYRFLTDGQARLREDCAGTVICVDIAAPSMAGRYADDAKDADIVIDHHYSNAGYGKACFVDASAAACGEIVLEIVSQLGAIDKCIADCLYTAISTDTGCFVYANTTAATHAAAARLIEAGADVKTLNKLLFRTKSPAAIEIERRALESMEYFYDRQIVCMRIELDWIRELSASDDDMESISSVPAQIEGVKAAATFRRIDETRYKLSVRTNGEIDAAAVCRRFGGGGHKMAAGCTMTGSYDKLKQIMADSLAEGFTV